MLKFTKTAKRMFRQQFKLRLLLDNDIAKVLAERWQSDPQSQFPATAIYSPLGLCDNFVQPSYGSNETKTLVTDPVFTAYGASNVTLSIHTWGWAGEYVVSAFRRIALFCLFTKILYQGINQLQHRHLQYRFRQ